MKTDLNIEKFYNQMMVVCHSSAVEGSEMDFEATTDLFEFESIKNSKVKDVFMVYDHYEALKFVLKLAENKTPLTVESIKIINGMVMKNTGSVGSHISLMSSTNPKGEYDNSLGEFRKLNVSAGKRKFMSPEKIESAVNKFVETFAVKLVKRS